MGVPGGKPFRPSEKSKKITKPSRSTAIHNQFLMAAHPAGAAVVDAGDWKNQLPPDSRQRMVNKIMDQLKRHLRFSGQEGLNELKKIAVRFEEKIYTAATSRSDYLRKTALKMLSVGSKSQNPMPNSLPSSTTGNSNEPLDQA